jgi:PAS domain S-box-containing protein
MTGEHLFAGVPSLEDAFLSLRGGQHVVVCSPQSDLSLDLLRITLARMPKNGTAVISFSHRARDRFDKKPRHLITLAAEESASRSLQLLKKSLAKVSGGAFLLVNVAENHPAFISSLDRQNRLIKTLCTLATAKQCRTIWFVRRHALLEAALTCLKESSDYFLHISRTGSAIYAQVIHARHTTAETTFSPRILTLTSTATRLSTPTISAAEGGSHDLVDQQYRHFFQSASEPMVVFELWGEYKELNRRAMDALGFDENELANLKLSDCVATKKRFTTLRELLTLKKKARHTFSTQIQRKNGRIVDVEISASSLGKNLFVAIVSDISERVQSAAASRALAAEYDAFVASLPYPYALFVNRKLAVKNAAFDALFPFVQSTSPSVSDFFGRRNATLLKDITDILDAPASETTIRHREVLIPAPERHHVATEVSISPIQYEGKKALYCTFVDVSARRKILEQAAATEERFKSLLAQSLDAISVVRDQKFILLNPRFAEMFGYPSAMELLGKSFTTILARGNVRTETVDRLSKLLEGKENEARFTYVGVRSDGTKLAVEAHASTITLDGAQALLMYHRDVSAWQRAEEEFDRKVKALTILNRIADEVGGALSLEQLHHRNLSAAMRLLQFEHGALLQVDRASSSLTLALHHNLSEAVQSKLKSQSLDESFARYFNKTHEPVIVMIAEYPAHLPFKALFEAEQYTVLAFLPLVVNSALYGVVFLATTRGRLLDDDDRTLLAALGRHVSIAIEKAMLVEQAREAEAKLAATVAQISDVLYTLQPNGTFEYISPNIERLIGYKPSDFTVNANLWRTLLHPDDRPTLSQRISNQAQGRKEFCLEYRILPKGKATYLWLRDAVRYRYNAAQEVVAIEGILTDITAQKALATRDTAAAITSGSRSDVAASLPDGVSAFDKDLRCIEWNAALEQITGILADQVLNKHVHEVPIIATQLERIVTQAVASNAEVADDIAFRKPNEEGETALFVRATPWIGDDNELLGAVALITDSANRRKLEEETTESEAMLRNVINTMGDALIISDLNGQVWEVNRAFTHLTGYSRDEARQSEFPYPWLYEGEVAPLVRSVTDLLEKKHLHDLDMTWLHKTGNHIAVSQNLTLLTDVHGGPMAVLHIARDISERRKLAVEVEWKSRQIQTINRIISFANTTSNVEKIFATIAQEVYGLVAFDGIAIVRAANETPAFLAVPTEGDGFRTVDSLPLDEETVRTAVTAKQLATKDAIGELPAQLSIPIFVNGDMYGVFSLIRRGSGSFIPEETSFLQPIAEEIGAIIQRLQLLQQVNDDSEYIHNLLNSINSVVFTVDNEYHITDMNEAFNEFIAKMGLTEVATGGTMIGKSLRMIMPDENAWRHFKRVMDDLFARRIERYVRNIEAGEGKLRVAYHLVINPMVIHERVTALVFTYTDITEINRSEEEIKQRNKELIALNAISTSISHSLNLDVVLQLAAEQIREIFAADVVTFYLLDQEENTLILKGHAGLENAIVHQIGRVDPGNTVSWDAIANRKPTFISDIMAQESVASEKLTIVRIVNVVSVAIIPLQLKGKGAGALTVGFRQRRDFSEKEKQLLILVGNQLSAAIENGLLYAEIHQQVETLKTLFELSKGLTGVLDLNSVLQVVYREVQRAIRFDRFYYQAYHPEQQTLSLLGRTVNGVPEFYPQGMKVRSLQDWPNTIYQDVVSYGRAYLGATSAAQNDSMIAVPIKSEDKVIGIISIVSSTPNVHTSSHLRLLESIATLTGIAIGKATLYEDTLRTSREIERRNKELDDFTYVVSHDLKEPLISIEGYSKIVMKDYGERLDAEGRDYLTAVVQSTTRMKHLIEDLLTLSRIGRMHEPYETVAVRKVVDEILYDLQWSLKEKNVVVTVAEDLPKVRYNGTRLSMVFRNLIANAMKFNDKPNPTIDIGVREEENEFVFSVADNGIGIEQQYFDRIFTIFQRLQRSEEYRGTGAGLTITKRIVEREGGKIWLESEPRKGSTFYFTIRKPTS